MTKLTNSRTGIWTHVSLCSSCSCPTPSVSLFWTPFSHRLSVCMSLCRMQLSGFPLSLLSPLLSCPFVSCPGSFHSLYFFFLFPVWTMGAGLATSWIVSYDNHILPWRSPCFFISLSWLDIKAEKGYRWRDEPFQCANYITVQMTLYQYNWVLNSSFLSLPAQYVKLEYFNLQEWLRSWRMNVKTLNYKPHH